MCPVVYFPPDAAACPYPCRDGQSHCVLTMVVGNPHAQRLASAVLRNHILPLRLPQVEGLYFEFELSWREVTDASFFEEQTEDDLMFGNPAGSKASAIAAGVDAASPPESNPLPPLTLEDTCHFRTSNNAMRVINAVKT